MRIEEEIQRRNLGPTHPAIAMMLAFAFVVVLVAVVFTGHPASWKDPEEVTPTVGAIYQPGSGDYMITIEKVDPEPADILKVRYILLNETNDPIPGIQGDLVDILNLDFSHESTNITFHDNDRDEHISRGDTFILKEARSGGITKPGYALLLVYIPTEEKINGGGTRLG